MVFGTPLDWLPKANAGTAGWIAGITAVGFELNGGITISP
jgi:hypothetical protein